MARTVLPLACIVAVAAVAAIAGCTSGEPEEDAAPADAVMQQQRDSIIGESNLPGASGVRGALEASEDAGDRAQRHDSLADDF